MRLDTTRFKFKIQKSNRLHQIHNSSKQLTIIIDQWVYIGVGMQWYIRVLMFMCRCCSNDASHGSQYPAGPLQMTMSSTARDPILPFNLQPHHFMVSRRGRSGYRQHPNQNDGHLQTPEVRFHKRK